MSLIYDVNPRHWLQKFQKNSILHLVKMAIFYHAISLGLTYAGSLLIPKIIPDYQAPAFPVSITMAATAAPTEEILFFGIPFYLTGNPYAILAVGSIWSIAHIFSTNSFALNGLGYVVFFATVPHLFFSLRTWMSGKGWFAILFHLSWNLAFLLSYCAAGFRGCPAIGYGPYGELDMYAMAIAASLVSIIILMHKKNKIARPVLTAGLVASIAVFATFEVLANLTYFESLF